MAYKLKLLADDTNLFVNGSKIHDLKTKCQYSIDLIAEWLSANKLTINYEKTSYMIFTPSHNIASGLDLDLCINNFEITKVSFAKYLKITIDENFDWKSHIFNLSLEIQNFIRVFDKLSFKLPSNIVKNLYFAFIYPGILYTVEICANTLLFCMI